MKTLITLISIMQIILFVINDSVHTQDEAGQARYEKDYKPSHDEQSMYYI